MPLSPEEELELLQLEEEEYQESLLAPKSTAVAPQNLQPDEDATLGGELLRSAQAFGAGINRAIPVGDELAGLAGGTASALRGEGFAPGYREASKLAKEEAASALADYPVAGAAGTAVGIAAPALATGGASTATQVGVAGGLGALSGETASERLGGAALGAGTALAVPAVVAKARELLNRGATASTRAALDLPAWTRQRLVDQEGPEYLQKIGEIARREGIGNAPGQGIVGMAERTRALQSDIGEAIGQQIKGIDVQVPGGDMLTGGPSAVRTLAETGMRKSGGLALPAEIASASDDIAARFSAKYGSAETAENLWSFAKDLDDMANTFGRAQDPAALSKAGQYADAAAQIRQTLRAQAPDEALQGLMQRYAEVSPLRAATDNMLVRAGAGAKASTLMSKAVTGVKPVHTTVNSILSKSSDLANRYGPMFEEAARRGSGGVSALHFSLLQTDPAYNAASLEEDE